VTARVNYAHFAFPLQIALSAVLCVLPQRLFSLRSRIPRTKGAEEIREGLYVTICPVEKGGGCLPIWSSPFVTTLSRISSALSLPLGEQSALTAKNKLTLGGFPLADLLRPKEGFPSALTFQKPQPLQSGQAIIKGCSAQAIGVSKQFNDLQRAGPSRDRDHR